MVAVAAATGQPPYRKADTMKKLIGVALPLGIALVSSPAFARGFTLSGNMCQPLQLAGSCAEPGQWGMGNTCAGAITFECPLPLSRPVGSNNVTLASMFVFDPSSTADVSCTLQRTDSAGAVLWSATKTTTGANCPTSPIKTWSDVAQPEDRFWRAGDPVDRRRAADTMRGDLAAAVGSGANVLEIAGRRSARRPSMRTQAPVTRWIRAASSARPPSFGAR